MKNNKGVRDISKIQRIFHHNLESQKVFVDTLNNMYTWTETYTHQ